jgi:phosphatidylglycerol:prolipoprotein diacylglycerol transferase
VSIAFWVHNFSPFLIRFNENFGIRYYGLSYLLGFLSSGWLLLKYHRVGRSPLDANAIFDLMTALIAGVILGGRLGYFLLYQHEYLFRDPLVLFRVWEGGMASHGGMLGVAVALWLFTRKRPVGMLRLSDLVISTAPLGLFFGRIANFINGELWGETTRVPWGVIFERTGGGPFPRHPSQLYEAALEGIFLFCYVQARFWKSNCTKLFAGQLTGEFLLLYAVVRSIGEIYREPDAGLILGLSRGTFYSVFLVGAGVALIAYARRPQSERKA